MEVILTELPDGQKEMLVTAPWEMVGDDHRDIMRRYLALPVRGFRPGKAPAGTIESMFREPIKNDLISAVSRRLCRTAMQDQNLEAGTPLEISEGELHKGEYLRFKATFIEMPQFALPDYIRLGLKSDQREEAIDEISARLLELTPLELHTAFIENELKYSDEDDNSVAGNEAATQRVRLMLILKKIAAQDGIEIDDRDISERIDRVAAENEVTSEELKQYLASGGGLSRLADALLAERVLDYLIEIQEP